MWNNFLLSNYIRNAFESNSSSFIFYVPPLVICKCVATFIFSATFFFFIRFFVPAQFFNLFKKTKKKKMESESECERVKLILEYFRDAVEDESEKSERKSRYGWSSDDHTCISFDVFLFSFLFLFVKLICMWIHSTLNRMKYWKLNSIFLLSPSRSFGLCQLRPKKKIVNPLFVHVWSIWIDRQL